ncbi:hypothetical protein ACHWQZ_G004609 [Mnemiopsis leidyi]
MTTVNDKELEDLLASRKVFRMAAQSYGTEPPGTVQLQSIAWRVERDPRDSDEESGDDMSILIGDSEDEDSEIEFSEGSDDEDD